MGRTRVRCRRRLAITMLCVAVAVVLSAPVAGALGRHEGVSGGVRPGKVYVVRSGDTVWSIAERIAAGRDPRAVVDEIAARNGIDAGVLVPGQSLILPSGA